MSLANPLAGETDVELEPGLVVRLRFTWAARAIIRQVFGDDWQTGVARSITTRDPQGLAVLLEAASDGAVTTAQALQSDWPLQEVAVAITKAWRFSHHGLEEPKAQQGAVTPNPMKRPRALSRMLCAVLRRLGLRRVSSGD